MLLHSQISLKNQPESRETKNGLRNQPRKTKLANQFLDQNSPLSSDCKIKLLLSSILTTSKHRSQSQLLPASRFRRYPQCLQLTLSVSPKDSAWPLSQKRKWMFLGSTKKRSELSRRRPSQKNYKCQICRAIRLCICFLPQSERFLRYRH
jgi:hypothetical protein